MHTIAGISGTLPSKQLCKYLRQNTFSSWPLHQGGGLVMPIALPLYETAFKLNFPSSLFSLGFLTPCSYPISHFRTFLPFATPPSHPLICFNSVLSASVGLLYLLSESPDSQLACPIPEQPRKHKLACTVQ